MVLCLEACQPEPARFPFLLQRIQSVSLCWRVHVESDALDTVECCLILDSREKLYDWKITES